MPTTPWPDSVVLSLKELWRDGHSTAEIGRRLGISKNAVVGKAHRLELDARPSPIVSGLGRLPSAPKTERPAVKRSFLPPFPSEKVAELPVMGPPVAMAMTTPWRVASPPQPRVIPCQPPIFKPIARRSSKTCCWPIGEPGTKSFRFCDDTSIYGRPYCEEHAKLAYVRLRPQREDVVPT